MPCLDTQAKKSKSSLVFVMMPSFQRTIILVCKLMFSIGTPFVMTTASQLFNASSTLLLPQSLLSMQQNVLLRSQIESPPRQRERRARKGGGSDDSALAACRTVCNDFFDTIRDNHKEDATCDCPPRTPLVVMKLPSKCEPVQNCPRNICAEYTIQGVLKVVADDRDDSILIELQSVEMWVTYRHAAYDGEGAYGNGDVCRQWFILDGLVYECQSCTPCPHGDGIFLDCSNIQPQAVMNQCNEGDEASVDLFSVFDYCPAGGAPQPSTEGTVSATGMETTSDATPRWSVTNHAVNSLLTFLVCLAVILSFLW